MLLASSLLASLAVCVISYEAYEHYRYYKWRAEYARGTDWHGRLTAPSPNPVLAWEYRPNGEYRNLRTNRYGFRDRDYDTLTKPDGVFRVAFVGDSVTLGLGVNATDTFVSQFERLLNEHGDQALVQAMNFGVDGYNVVQVHELLRTKVLAFKPDLVVYVMSLNDFNLGASTGEKMGFFHKPASFFLMNAAKLYTRLSVVGKVSLTASEMHWWWFETGKDAVFREVGQMRDLLRSSGTRFHLALVPIFRFEGHTFRDYPLERLHAKMASFCHENGIPFTDLLRAFQRLSQSPGTVGDDIWHPDADGHRLIAEELAEALPDGRGAGLTSLR